MDILQSRDIFSEQGPGRSYQQWKKSQAFTRMLLGKMFSLFLFHRYYGWPTLVGLDREHFLSWMCALQPVANFLLLILLLSNFEFLRIH